MSLSKRIETPEVATMAWGIILLFLLRIALPILVGFGLSMLIERWQRNQEKEVIKRQAYST